MLATLRRFAVVPWVLTGLLSGARAQAGITLIAADETGVTLKVTAPAGTLQPAGDGRFDLVVRDASAARVPGRPRLPSYGTLVALPPGARATVRILTSDPEREQSVRLAPAIKPGFERPPGEAEYVPVAESIPMIADGSWPATPVELGEPYMLRRQRLVAVSVRPWRYDETSGRLWSRAEMTVRIDFTGGDVAARGAISTGEADAHWDAVLREGVINFDHSRGWRRARAPLQRGGVRSSSLFAPGAGAGGPVENEPEVRVRLDSTGVWALDYDELANRGYPPNTPIASVSVHRHEFVENQSPPYQTIELPIEVVNSNGNAVFDSGDYIVVWVQSWAARSRASLAQRRWGDGEVIYATRSATPGLRIPERAGWRGTPGLTPLASYPWTQRWKHTYHYDNFPADTLREQFLWRIDTPYGQPDSFSIETNQIDTSRPIDFSLRMQGLGNNPHYVYSQVLDGVGGAATVADWESWFGRDPYLVSKTLPGTALREGGGNRLRVWGKNTGGAPTPGTTDNASLDWYQATYWRGFRSLNNYLACNSGDQGGEYQIRATAFSSNDGTDIRVYDVTDSLAPVKLTIDPAHVLRTGPSTYDVEFQDLTTPGVRRSYVACATPRLPASDRFETVTRAHLTTGPAADYLVVVPEELRPAVAPLVAMRQAQGLRVLVAPLEAIQDEFNGGRKSSYAIKRFVRHAFEQWDARFLLLVGDGNEDPQNLLRWSSKDWVPVQVISGPVPLGVDYEVVASDPWYVCLEGTCSVFDMLPDAQSLFVGRLPVRDLAEAQGEVAKIVAYENFAADQTWRSVLLLSSDDEFSTGLFGGFGGNDYCRTVGEGVFRRINERIMRMVVDDAGFRQSVMDTFHLDWWLRNERILPGTACRDRQQTISDTRGSVTPFLLTRLNEGRLWWNFQGHANSSQLTHEFLYQNLGGAGADDKDRLLNAQKPFLFSAFSCHANQFTRVRDLEDGRDVSGMGEEMTRMPSVGAIASWASTGYEILPDQTGDHINLEWARTMFLYPPHDDVLGDRGARVVLGETIALGLANYVPFVQSDQNERGIVFTYHLMGDPATRLSIGAPQSSVTANSLPVTDDQPVRLHTPGNALRIDADLVSNTAIDTIIVERTDAAGTVVLPPSGYTLTPAFPDTAAAGLGGRRYALALQTTLTPTSHRFTLRTTDRYGVTGDFDVVFQFLTNLRLDETVIADGDIVPPAGNLSIRVLSPSPLVPASDLSLTINGAAQAFTASPVPGDASGREWILAWNHTP